MINAQRKLLKINLAKILYQLGQLEDINLGVDERRKITQLYEDARRDAIKDGIDTTEYDKEARGVGIII
jgi:hypothetical protein